MSEGGPGVSRLMDFPREIFDRQLLIPTQDDGAFHGVFQLPHIARPGYFTSRSIQLGATG